MMTNSLVQQSLRRLASRNPSIFKSTTNGIIRMSAPAAIASGQYMSYRPATTDATKDYDAILAKQRLNRPVAPHLTIYRPQITWILSSFTRITGVALSGTFYLFGLTYLVAPLFGWQLGSAALAASFAGWPIVAKFLVKFVAALPFTFHAFNGVRHLVWDVVLGLKNQQVIQTGWAVVGLTLASTLGLAIM